MREPLFSPVRLVAGLVTVAEASLETLRQTAGVRSSKAFTTRR